MKDKIWKLESGLWAVRHSAWTWMVASHEHAVRVMNDDPRSGELILGTIVRGEV